MLRCADCGKIIPAAENKFKFPADLGTVHACNACGIKRIAAATGGKVEEEA